MHSIQHCIDGFKYPRVQTLKVQPVTLYQIHLTWCNFMCQRLLIKDSPVLSLFKWPKCVIHTNKTSTYLFLVLGQSLWHQSVHWRFSILISLSLLHRSYGTLFNIMVWNKKTSRIHNNWQLFWYVLIINVEPILHAQVK